MRFSIFHLGIENDDIHVGGLFEMETSAPREEFLLEAVADGKSVSSAPGGFREFREPDAPKKTTSRFWDFTIPADSSKPFHVSFLVRFPDGHSEPCRIDYRNNASLSEKTRTSYFRMHGRLFFSEPPYGFLVRPASFFRHILAELRYDAWLLFKQPRRRSKAAIPIRWMALFLRPILLKRRIWILTDRVTFADDNGLALFRHLMSRRKEIGCHPIFFLARNSPDWEQVRSIGPVCRYTPLRYRLATLGAEWTISSGSHGFLLNPLNRVSDGYRGLAPDRKVAFLQHGITMNDISVSINRANVDLSLFVTAAVPEHKFIVETTTFGFDKRTISLTGFPRYDLLENHRENIITFMPTWRLELFNGWDPTTGKGILKDGLEQSAFFRHLQSPLTSQRLLDAADRMGYRIHFFPHPVWQPYLDRFVFDHRVSMISATTRYREVFARSAVCVTDWSSSIFDFAWMQKPVVYYQPDNDLHYRPGYFEYARNGFGPVTHSAEELIDHLIDLMKRGCPMDEPYRTRSREFFAFHDHGNCKRVTEALCLTEHH